MLLSVRIKNKNILYLCFYYQNNKEWFSEHIICAVCKNSVSHKTTSWFDGSGLEKKTEPYISSALEQCFSTSSIVPS